MTNVRFQCLISLKFALNSENIRPDIIIIIIPNIWTTVKYDKLAGVWSVSLQCLTCTGKHVVRLFNLLLISFYLNQWRFQANTLLNHLKTEIYNRVCGGLNFWAFAVKHLQAACLMRRFQANFVTLTHLKVVYMKVNLNGNFLEHTPQRVSG